MSKKIYLEEKSTNVRSLSWRKEMSFGIKKFLWKYRPEKTEELMVDYIFKPRPYLKTYKHDDILKSGKEFFLPVKDTGKYLRVIEIGEGPAVIVAHGWASSLHQMTSFIPKLLAQGFSVVVYDQPAHGKSTSVSTNLFDFIRSLEAIIKYKKDIHAIIAHSMACSAALYNLHLFQWIKKGVLIAPHYDFEEELIRWFNSRGMPEELMRDFVTYLENRFHLELDGINPKNVAPFLNHTDIMLIHDEGDRYAPIKGSEKLHLNLPKSELTRTSGLGHAKILHDEKIINDIVQFLIKG